MDSRIVAAFAACAGLLACHPDPTGPDIPAARRRVAQGYASAAPDIDVFGDGKAHILRQFSGSTILRTEVRVDGVTVSTEDVTAATRVYTLFASGRPLRRIETTPTDQGQSVRVTWYAADASEPDVRRSWDEDFQTDDIQVTEEQDAAHDGTFVETGSFSSSRRMKDVVVPGGGVSGSNCGSAQVDALRAAIETALDQGLSCLGKLEPAFVPAILQYVAGHHIDVICGGGSTDRCGDFTSLPNGDGIIRIFSPHGPGCGTLASTVFHELLHGLYGGHREGDGTTDPADPVFGCERTCFESATSLSCSACLGVENGTGACNKLPFEPCPESYCGCTKTYYAHEPACVAECGNSAGSDPFGCAFAGICGPPPSSRVCR